MSKYRKLIAAVCGGIANVIAVGLVHGDARLWCVVLLGAATAAGVYRATNAPA